MSQHRATVQRGLGLGLGSGLGWAWRSAWCLFYYILTYLHSRTYAVHLRSCAPTQVDVALSHHGERAAFGHDTTPDPAAAALPHSPRMAAVVPRPESCAICHAVSTETSFKNVRKWPTVGAPPGSFSRMWRCRACKAMFQRDEAPHAPQGSTGEPAAVLRVTPSVEVHAARLLPLNDPEEVQQLVHRWQQQRVLAGCV